jgi:FkbM family methyltransferase
MVEVHKIGWSRIVAKKVLPRLGPVLSARSAQQAFSLFEAGAAILQGKGAGTGWDADAETKVAIPWLGPTAVVFDVGANKGCWTRNLLRSYRESLSLFLFEPQDSCQQHLADLAATGCTIVKSAVGDHNGMISFYSPAENAGNASVYDRKDSYFEDQQFKQGQVPILTLDSFVAEQDIQHIDYMKVDVEGHELAVLRGAENLISRGGIPAIAFEFGSADIFSRTFFRDFWDFFSRYGYKVARITPGGRLANIPRYYEDLEYFRGCSNYLAMRSG